MVELISQANPSGVVSGQGYYQRIGIRDIGNCIDRVARNHGVSALGRLGDSCEPDELLTRRNWEAIALRLDRRKASPRRRAAWWLSAAAAAAVLAHTAGLAPSLSFFVGLAAGALFSPLDYRLRSARSAWNPLVEAQVRAGVFSLRRWVARSLLIENAAMAAYVFAWFAAAALLAQVPGLARLYPGTDFAYALMPWLGLSGLYFRFRTQIYKKG